GLVEATAVRVLEVEADGGRVGEAAVEAASKGVGDDRVLEGRGWRPEADVCVHWGGVAGDGRAGHGEARSPEAGRLDASCGRIGAGGAGVARVARHRRPVERQGQ